MDLGLLCLEDGGEVSAVGGWGAVRIGTTSSFLQSLHISLSSFSFLEVKYGLANFLRPGCAKSKMGRLSHRLHNKEKT